MKQESSRATVGIPLVYKGEDVNSSDLGTRKPDANAYRAVLDTLETAPEEVLFVDDRPVNLAPARSLGMPAILFRSDDTDAHPEPSAERNPYHSVATMPELVAAVRALRSFTGAERPVDPRSEPL